MIYKSQRVHPRNRKAWLPEEDSRLIDLSSKYNPQTVSSMMKRSLHGLASRLHLLKVSKRLRTGWYNESDIAEIFGVSRKWVLSRIIDGTLKATPHSGDEVTGGRSWHVREEDLKNYIRRYPQELNGRPVDMVMIVDILAGIKLYE